MKERKTESIENINLYLMTVVNWLTFTIFISI